jgi:4'-phosphopantetheinyl transferase EntD
MSNSSSIIAPILPPGMAAAEAFNDDFNPTLLPEEVRALGSVSERRRHDFTAGRSCARRALTALGFHPTPILPGRSREPLWPEGIVGSITHCPGYSVAVAGFTGQFHSAGVDAEVHAPLPDNIFEMISLEGEQRWRRDIPDRGICWDRLLFSAKESIYKAWFPITGKWLGFDDVFVTVNPEERRFSAQVLLPAGSADERSPASFEGRWLATDTHILTLVVVDRKLS